ncbi:hypothetical protein [Nocardia sp. NPDC046763]|uniref:hypothetical protein n=1 Tax=Nocardia sp. NPDC046763 TaxID=3155256 RepID=UPI0033E18221
MQFGKLAVTSALVIAALGSLPVLEGMAWVGCPAGTGIGHSAGRGGRPDPDRGARGQIIGIGFVQHR